MDKSNLPIPYSTLDESKEIAQEAYFRHKTQNRYINVGNAGITKVTGEAASKIASLNLRMGKAIHDTLNKGFGALEKQQIQIHQSLLDQTQVIQTGFDTVEFALHKGFGKVEDGLEDVAHSVDQVGELIVKVGGNLDEGIAGVKASLDMGMVSIVSQFELQRSEIQKGFESLTHILENQHKTKAQERYLDGKRAYEQFLQHPDEPQFLMDAHQYFEESIQSYRGNPFCHLYLGHIYQEAASFYDLDKSLEHYLFCATYAKGMVNNDLAALGYFLGAWVAYVQADLPKAIELGKLSIEFDAKGNPEAYFNLGKYHAYMRDAEAATHFLDTAVSDFDPLYTLKASLDADFQKIKQELEKYFIEKRDQEAKLLTEKLTQFGVKL